MLLKHSIGLLASSLQNHVKILSQDYGPRNFQHYIALTQAANYIHTVFHEYQFLVTVQEYQIKDKIYSNIEAELPGANSSHPLVIVGAHYDSAGNSPGANDNASGIAVMLEIARLLAAAKPDCPVKFVAFVNEEPPFTHTKQMGSYYYAKHLRSLDFQVKAMLSLETIGCYTEKRGEYGPPVLKYLLPYRQNFLAFIGNRNSKDLVKNASDYFKSICSIPIKTLSAWGFLPGIKSSDQESFWKQGYQGIMVTDTAWARDWQAYHTQNDTYDRINYDKLTEATIGLAKTIFSLSQDCNDKT
ncbi:MAG: M28 family peptidase [Proteobacteria bacterium]|nr:M28 family peptidase [Pseudomonadota bacterium]